MVIWIPIFVRNPCILHLNGCILFIAHILVCYFGGIIFLEYESDLWAIEHYLIWDSVTVSELFQDYKNRSDSLLGGFYGENSDLFPRWVSCELGT